MRGGDRDVRAIILAGDAHASRVVRRVQNLNLGKVEITLDVGETPIT